MRTLILNAGYEPMQLISWERALCLVLAEKAEVLHEYGALARSVSLTFNLPSVVRLKRYVRVVKKLDLCAVRVAILFYVTDTNASTVAENAAVMTLQSTISIRAPKAAKLFGLMSLLLVVHVTDVRAVALWNKLK